MTETIDLEERDSGKRVTVALAHYRRWQSAIDVSFRPVSDKKTAPAVVTVAPTGEETKEN